MDWPGEATEVEAGVFYRPTRTGLLTPPAGRFVDHSEWDLWLAAIGSDDPLDAQGEFVYGSLHAGVLKIGSSWCPLVRGGHFGTIVLIEPGGVQRELALHRMFSHLRTSQFTAHGGDTEWFWYREDLQAYVVERNRRLRLSRSLRGKKKTPEHKAAIASSMKERWRQIHRLQRDGRIDSLRERLP